jgi:hypothetical protein
MSFVIATPELIQGAAEDLAGIRSSLAEATVTVGGSTTGVAAAAEDEISIAIASMFGNFGQEFQVLSAQAQAFHAEFVTLINAGAGAYLSAEVANAEQTLLGAANAPARSLFGGGMQGYLHGVSNAVVGAPAALQAAQTTGAPALLNGISSFGATVAAPYQLLVSNTATNLQSLGGAVAANPAPFVHQFFNNQLAYAQTIGTGFLRAVQNLPAELANLPVTIQAAIQGFLVFNPVFLAQQFIDQQIGYAQLIATSLQNAGNDFVAGLAALPANLQAASQAFMAGNISGGLLLAGGSLLDPFFAGFKVSQDPVTGLITITAKGSVGDLIPILGIPAQMAQNFTNLIPPGTIPAMVSQNATNVIATLTDLSQTLDLNTGDLHIGLPLALALDAVGPPVTTLAALGSSASAFVGAVETGDGLGATAALIDAPAVVANGFLNGQTALSLTSHVGTLETTTSIPLGGILTPLEFGSLSISGVPGSTTLSGTTFGGILPGLLIFLPGQLAEAIGAPPIS